MVEKVAVIRGFKGFQKILTQKISSTYYAGSYIKTNGAATIYFWRTIGEQAMKAFIYKGLNVFFDGSNPIVSISVPLSVRGFFCTRFFLAFVCDCEQ